MEVAMSYNTNDKPTLPDNQDETLGVFEAKQSEAFRRAVLESFAQKELVVLEEIASKQSHRFDIKIDRVEYAVHKEHVTGLELRNVPQPAVGSDRDLFEVVPGESDRKILDDTVVKIHDSMRFFAALRRSTRV
jgi:hypothetical protein